MTSTRVIELSHDLPTTPADRADERDRTARPSRARCSANGRADDSSPGEAALVALARLLGRQAAREHLRPRGDCDDRSHGDPSGD